MKSTSKSQPRTRRSMLRAGLFGGAAAGATQAQGATSSLPKKQIIGLKPGEVRRGALLSGTVRSGNFLFLSGTGEVVPQPAGRAG